MKSNGWFGKGLLASLGLGQFVCGMSSVVKTWVAWPWYYDIIDIVVYMRCCDTVGSS